MSLGCLNFCAIAPSTIHLSARMSGKITPGKLLLRQSSNIIVTIPGRWNCCATEPKMTQRSSCENLQRDDCGKDAELLDIEAGCNYKAEIKKRRSLIHSLPTFPVTLGTPQSAANGIVNQESIAKWAGRALALNQVPFGVRPICAV